MAVDAIVNTANEGPEGGGGVEYRRISYCRTGSAVILITGETGMGKHVIHIMGPFWWRRAWGA